MTHMDFSLSAGTFSALVRRRAQQSPICETSPIFEELLIDHVEIGPPVLERGPMGTVVINLEDSTINVQAPTVLLHIPISAFLTTPSEIRAGGLTGPTPTDPFKVTATYQIRGEVDTATASAGIRMEYLSKDKPVPDADADAALEDRFRQAGAFVSLPLGDIGSLVDRAVVAKNVGVAIDTAATRFVVRIEETPLLSAQQMWSTFFASPPDRLGGKAWAILLPGAWIESMVVKTFKDGIDSDSSLDRTGWPHASWQGGSPCLTFEAEADVLGACPITGAVIGIDFNGTLDLAMHGLQIVSTLAVGLELDGGDIALCGLSTGAALAVAGAIVGALFGPIGAAIGFVVGLVAGIVAVVALASSSGLGSAPSLSDCQSTLIDERNFQATCTQALPVVTDVATGRFEPTTLVNDPSGLILSGNALIEAGDLKLIVEPEPLQWQGKTSCSSRTTELELGGGVALSLFLFQTVPFSVCCVDVVDDKAGIFYTSIEWISNGRRKVHVHIKESRWDAYVAAGRYPCHLAVMTSLGARFIDLGSVPDKPPPIDPIEKSKLYARYCLRAYDQFWRGRFNPLWLPDPPPNVEVMHWWRIGAQGLEPGDRVRVLMGDHELVGATADSNGRAEVQTVVPPSVSPTLGREGRTRSAHAPPFNARDHGLAIVQTLLVSSGHATLIHPADGLAILSGFKQPMVVTFNRKTGMAVWQFDTATPIHRFGKFKMCTPPLQVGPAAQSGPSPARHIDMRVDDIIALPRGILVLTSEGMMLWKAEPDGTMKAVKQSFRPRPDEIVVMDERVILREGDVLSILDLELRHLARYKVENCKGISASQGLLRVDTADTSELLSVPGIEAPRIVRGACCEESAGGGETTPGLATAAPDRSAIMDRKRDCAMDSWLKSAVWVNGSMLVRLEENGLRLATYRKGRTVIL